jgi:hypothetical protein
MGGCTSSAESCHGEDDGGHAEGRCQEFYNLFHINTGYVNNMLNSLLRLITVGANIESKNGKLTICPFFFFHFNISRRAFKIRLPPTTANLHSFNHLIILNTDSLELSQVIGCFLQKNHNNVLVIRFFFVPLHRFFGKHSRNHFV